MDTDFSRNNGFATREEVVALGPLDLFDLSQLEFKDITDARNGHLTLPALERLRAAVKRQADARGDDGRRRIFFVTEEGGAE
jgi:hypothetical protein